MSKHTPGKWRIGNTSSTEQDIFNADGSIFIGFVSNTNTQSLEENKANARLIAVAPTMYEALESISKLPDSYPIEVIRKQAKRIIEVINA